MTADEPVAGVPRLCARRADCTRPRGHDDECGPGRDQARVDTIARAVGITAHDAEFWAVGAILAITDTELADLRAEVDRLSVLAEDWRGRYVEAYGDAQRWEDATDTAEAERDALQRQVDAALAMAVEWSRQPKPAGTDSGPYALGHLAGQQTAYASASARLRAALDAVEPADQPHPTPEADER